MRALDQNNWRCGSYVLEVQELRSVASNDAFTTVPFAAAHFGQHLSLVLVTADVRGLITLTVRTLLRNNLGRVVDTPQPLLGL